MLTDSALADIQGFITSGYGHLRESAYVLLGVRDAAKARRWLARLLPQVATAAPWPKTADGTTIKPASAVNVAFTAAGLEALGLSRRVRCSFPVEFQEGMAAPDCAARLGDTGESAPARWAFGGPAGPPLHIVLLLHGGATPEALRDPEGGVVEIGVERGYRPDDGREPFGFHDGIAQPPIAGIAGRGVPTGEFILGYENHYQVIPPGPVVPEDEAGSARLPPLENPYHRDARLRDLGRHGSFVVYRKLQQDVAGFWRFVAGEARRLTGRDDRDAAAWLAAKMMGRWPSGAPVTLTPDHDDPRLRERDDFLYDDDRDGARCPLGAHVRRANPRAVIHPYGVATSLSMTEAHRLLRRGRVFGPPAGDPLADDGEPRGIHFLCVNASITSQFEFVQQTWCNNPRFSGLRDNRDPIVGDQPSRMSIPHAPEDVLTEPLPRFVQVRGGAYLFMPGMAGLEFVSA